MVGSGSLPTLEINRAMLRKGIGLMGVGGLLWLFGASLTAAAVAQASRQWVGQLEESPGTMARRRVAQLRVATVAGADAWRQHDLPEQRRGSSSLAGEELSGR